MCMCERTSFNLDGCKGIAYYRSILNIKDITDDLTIKDLPIPVYCECEAGQLLKLENDLKKAIKG